MSFKKLICICQVFFYSVLSFAQINQLRYNDDFSYLNEDTLKSVYKSYKFSRLNSSNRAYISQGGELRYLIQHFTNEDWQSKPIKSYNSTYTRLLNHADVHFNSKTRFFLQANSTLANGRSTPPRSIDENLLSIHQLFGEFRIMERYYLRLGRQELLFGAQRLISVREGPNNRLSFDSVRISRKKKSQLDFFYAQPIVLNQGYFDDKMNSTVGLWSAYWSSSELSKIYNLDLYYIGFWSESISYLREEQQREIRNSFGMRIWKKTKNLKIDFESVFQSGRYGENSILAYTASIDAAYSFIKRRASPTLGLKTEIISGDNSPDDDQLNTFNPLFPRGAYFGLAALIGPVNIIDCHPSAEITIMKNIVLSVDYDYFWRTSKSDGIYGPNVKLIYNENSNSTDIGQQIGAALEHSFGNNFKMTCEGMYFIAGPYLSDVSEGHDVIFAALTFQLKY